MPNNPIAMLILRRLLLLTQRGLSIRAMAHELQLSGTTIMDYRKRIRDSGKTPEELLILQDKELSALLSPIKQPPVDRRLAEYLELQSGYMEELAQKRATRIILFEQYTQLCPDGFGYSKFCQLLAESKKATKATIHHTYLPADKMMFDFAGTPLRYIDPDSERMF